MIQPTSAIEHQPEEFMREVSPEAIRFYVEELRSLRLPLDFRAEHACNEYLGGWDTEDRLKGKFGRFTLEAIDKDVDPDKLADVLVMGTTIGLGALDGTGRYARLRSLRHYSLFDAAEKVLMARGLEDVELELNEVDFGSTTIRLNPNSVAKQIVVSAESIDFGRADAEGRLQTCQLFSKLLGDQIAVVSLDPAPDRHSLIIE